MRSDRLRPGSWVATRGLGAMLGFTWHYAHFPSEEERTRQNTVSTPVASRELDFRHIDVTNCSDTKHERGAQVTAQERSHCQGPRTEFVDFSIQREEEGFGWLARNRRTRPEPTVSSPRVALVPRSQDALYTSRSS